jgi:glucoamylase
MDGTRRVPSLSPAVSVCYISNLLLFFQGDAYFGGNPWHLTTAALASLYYRAAGHILQSQSVPDSQTLSLWKVAMNAPNSLPTDIHSLAKIFAQQGDGVLLRLRAHLTASGSWHLAEQLDKNSGAQISAENLTWSVSKM